MVLRRSLFDNGWGWHEALGVGTAIPGGEENRALYDVVRMGHTLEYRPDSIVRHGATLTAARRRRILRASVAYAVKLMVEEPGSRGRVLRYYWRGRRRYQRPALGKRTLRSRLDVLRALGVGPLLYLRSRLGSTDGSRRP
jgi:hypothetical protein